jgi:DNA segregation ATPase FtsK/SpoIIIE-like protein
MQRHGMSEPVRVPVKPRNREVAVPDPYDNAVASVMRQTWISTTKLMRVFGEPIGYNRCAYFLARMEIEGIVGPIDDEFRRDVLRRIN